MPALINIIGHPQVMHFANISQTTANVCRTAYISSHSLSLYKSEISHYAVLVRGFHDANNREEFSRQNSRVTVPSEIVCFTEGFYFTENDIEDI